LLTRAQDNDQQAIDELCERFKPLVYKEAYRSNIFNALGEDAVNVAWTIFLSFTRRYNGADYLNLPGLIQCHLRYELSHYVCKKGLSWENEVTDTEAIDAETGFEHDQLQNLLLNMALYQELKKLSPRQLKIIWLYYFANETHEAIAKVLHCSTRTVGYQREKALAKLKSRMLR